MNATSPVELAGPLTGSRTGAKVQRQALGRYTTLGVGGEAESGCAARAPLLRGVDSSEPARGGCVCAKGLAPVCCGRARTLGLRVAAAAWSSLSSLVAISCTSSSEAWKRSRSSLLDGRR